MRLLILVLMMAGNCFAADGIRPNAATDIGTLSPTDSIGIDRPNTSTAYKTTPAGIKNYIQSELSGVLAPSTHVHPFANTSTASGGFMSPTDKTNLDALYDSSVPNSKSEGAIGDGTWHSLSSYFTGLGITDSTAMIAAAQEKWPLLQTIHSWTASGAALSGTSDAMRLTSTGNDPIIQHPVTVTGTADNGTLVIRYKRVAGSGWDGFALYRNAAWQYSIVPLGANPAIGEWVTVTVDMATGSGGTPLAWVGAVVTELRLDLGTSADDVFDIDYVTLNGVALTTARHPISGTSKLAEYGVDWCAIQNGAAKAAAEGKAFVVSKGTYIIERTVEVRGITFAGSTTATSTLQPYSSFTGTALIKITGGDTVARHIQFSAATSKAGIWVASGSVNTIERCKFNNLNKGIILGAGSTNIRSNNFYDTTIPINYAYNNGLYQSHHIIDGNYAYMSTGYNGNGVNDSVFIFVEPDNIMWYETIMVSNNAINVFKRFIYYTSRVSGSASFKWFVTNNRFSGLGGVSKAPIIEFDCRLSPGFWATLFVTNNFIETTGSPYAVGISGFFSTTITDNVFAHYGGLLVGVIYARASETSLDPPRVFISNNNSVAFGGGRSAANIASTATLLTQVDVYSSSNGTFNGKSPFAIDASTPYAPSFTNLVFSTVDPITIEKASSYTVITPDVSDFLFPSGASSGQTLTLFTGARTYQPITVRNASSVTLNVKATINSTLTPVAPGTSKTFHQYNTDAWIVYP